MSARDRSSVFIIILVLALFILRWPVDNYVCNPKTWVSHKYRNERTKKLVVLRAPSQIGDRSFFSTVLAGGAGTPAMFALLGGQRYLVANIIWNYSDVLFHQGKPYEMVPALESTVTLNPGFTEAWSVYGWHLAWNLHTYAENNIVEKKLRLEQGEAVYLRAIDMDPKKPRHYFDLAWLYIQRMGAYEKALPYLKEVVEDGATHGFKVAKLDPKGQPLPDPTETSWIPSVYGNRLAFVYKKIGIIKGDPTYFQKAIDTYKATLKLDPKNEAAVNNMRELQEKMYDAAWIKEQQKDEANMRERYGMTTLTFGEANMSPASEFYKRTDKTMNPKSQ